MKENLLISKPAQFKTILFNFIVKESNLDSVLIHLFVHSCKTHSIFNRYLLLSGTGHIGMNRTEQSSSLFSGAHILVTGTNIKQKQIIHTQTVIYGKMQDIMREWNKRI